MMNWRKSRRSQYNGNCVEVSSGWRKASYSFNGPDCVEVAGWRKASYSVNNGACVETASGDDLVAVRDTTDRDGVTLAFSADTWTRFLRGLRALS